MLICNPPEDHPRPPCFDSVSDFVRAVSVGDIDLDRNDIRLVRSIQDLNVLINDLRFRRWDSIRRASLIRVEGKENI